MTANLSRDLDEYSALAVGGRWSERIAEFGQKFVSEVAASVLTTACIAAATTVYLKYPEWFHPAPAPKADVSVLFSPTADVAATHFSTAAIEPSWSVAPPAVTVKGTAPLPPVRHKVVAASAKPVARPLLHDDVLSRDAMALAAAAPASPFPDGDTTAPAEAHPAPQTDADLYAAPADVQFADGETPRPFDSNALSADSASRPINEPVAVERTARGFGVLHALRGWRDSVVDALP